MGTPVEASLRRAKVALMQLYMFEHCSLCFRVRMTAALKRIHLQETVVLDDDSETMTTLVGKRQIPILVKDDGTPMLESMHMVKYIDGLGELVLTGAERSDIAAWADAMAGKTAPLTWPRYPLLGLPVMPSMACGPWMTFACCRYCARRPWSKAFGSPIRSAATLKP
jgi:glutaredoxin 2